MMMTSWEEILRVNLGRDISQQKLEKVIRIIDIHFAGLITHDLIFKNPLKYKTLTKDFLELMMSYLE